MKDRTTPTRFARNTGAAVVAGIAGWVSYWHQVEVALIAGEHVTSAHLIPFSVDGLLVVTSIAMVDARQQGRRPHWVVRVGFAAGIAASIGANIAAALPTVLSRSIAGWPALALLLVVEALSRRGKLLPVEQLPVPAQPAGTEPVQQQAQRVVDRAATVLPVPVSPAPAFSDEDEDERTPSGRGPIARRPFVSPLTGRVLAEKAPRV